MHEKMNPEIKAKWLAALRSGAYPQGRHELRTIDGGYCCLGVLCDVHKKETGGAWDNDGSYLGTHFYTPFAVSEWANMPDSDPKIPTSAIDLSRIVDATIRGCAKDRGVIPVSNLNDHGFTFAEIADLIEAHL